MSDARLAAALRLEEEIGRLLGEFGQAQATLIRSACQVDDDIVDLAPVVATTLYGHTLVALRKLYGREWVERMTKILLDADDAAAKAKDGEHSVTAVVDDPLPPRELRH